MRPVAAILIVLALALSPLACVSMSPNVYRDDMGVRLVDEGTPAAPDWTSPSLKKAWTEGESGSRDKKRAPASAYTADQGYMLLLRKPKVSTKRHEKDLVSEMIWAREKSRNK